MTQKPNSPNVNRQINENLQRVYSEALNQELPDKFLDLIARLDSSSKETRADDK